MTRHSKNNTTAGSFTYAERQKLNYGSKSSRCSKDNLRPWTHCHLCLKPAVEPTSCPRGHLSCRECVLEDILSQRSRFRAKLAEEARERKEAEDKKEVEGEEKRRETLKEFLIQQQQIGIKRSRFVVEVKPTTDPYTISKPQTTSTFQAVCIIGSDGPHPISLKSLIPVKFVEIEPKVPGCPSCLKPFASITRARLNPKCGHVICDSCHTNLKIVICLVCNGSVLEGDLVVLEAEGTGFAGGGGIVETKRYDVAFQ